MGLRLTLQTELVLQALLASSDEERYGLQIVEETGLPPGTIYPILARLEAQDWIASRWEDTDPHAEGRPRRRYYRLTAAGNAEAREALAQRGARRRSGWKVRRAATGGTA